MDLVKIHTKENFANAVIPEGQALIFTTLDESGNPVTMYKDKEGNFGTIAGGSSSNDTEVTYGYFVNNGDSMAFQQVSGGNPVGDPIVVDVINIVNTGVDQPEYNLNKSTE